MSIRSFLRHQFLPELAQYPRIKRELKKIDISMDVMKHMSAKIFPGIIQPEPFNITIAITSNCNLYCIGCRYGRDFMPNQQLSLSMIRKVLNDAKQLGITTVRLYGGEPLLHPDLPYIVEYCLKLGLEVYITTNGILLRDKFDDLYRAGLRGITIGFYGTGENYNKYVQRENQFSKLEESIAYLRERYDMEINLRLNWLLTKQSCNLLSLQETLKFAERYALSIQIDLVHYSLPYFSEGPNRLLQFTQQDLPAIELVVAKLISQKKENPQMFNHSLIGLQSIPDWLLKGPEMRVPCDKYQMIWVGADGTVQLCYVGFKLGNLHKQRLTEMLFTKMHKQAAQDAFSLKCPNCHCAYDSRIQKDLRSIAYYKKKYG